MKALLLSLLSFLFCAGCATPPPLAEPTDDRLEAEATRVMQLRKQHGLAPSQPPLPLPREMSALAPPDFLTNHHAYVLVPRTNLVLHWLPLTNAIYYEVLAKDDLGRDFTRADIIGTTSNLFFPVALDAAAKCFAVNAVTNSAPNAP